MARIIGAIATSHTPTIGFAYDGKKQNDPVWKPIFDAYDPIRAWLDENKPDVMFSNMYVSFRRRALRLNAIACKDGQKLVTNKFTSIVAAYHSKVRYRNS
jgi:hypothetical protein